MRSLGQIAASGKIEQDEDLSNLRAESAGRETDPEFSVTWSFILSIPKPVIAAVNGPCAGMSFVIAALCDMRFASEKAVFTTSFSQRGLIAEHGISWILPRLLGPSKALDRLWSARKFYAIEAERLGVVDRVVPHDDLLPDARAYVDNLARSGSPTAAVIL